MTTRHVCLWALVFDLSVTGAGAQGRTGATTLTRQLEVSHVNNQPASDGAVVIDTTTPITARGALPVSSRDDMVSVQLIVRRVYDGYVVITDRATFFSEPRPGVALAWATPPFRLPQPDLGQGWDVTAVVVRNDALPSGPIDDETVQRVALRTSNPVRVRSMSGPVAAPGDGGCSISIRTVRDVYGAYVLAGGTETEVGLTADLTGVMDRPQNAYEYLVVKTTASSNVWVMPSNRTRTDRSWRGAVYLGRPGMDFGETYVIKAVMLRMPIVEDRDYSAPAWNAIERAACAVSDDVIVRRRVGPGDLRITKVNHAIIANGGPIDTNTEPQVEGDIEDPQPSHALRPGETVWIFSRPIATEGWRVAALAVVQPDRLSWRAPAVRFLQPGEHHLMAVAGTTQLRVGRVLTADDWYNLARLNLIRRLSRTVIVRPDR